MSLDSRSDGDGEMHQRTDSGYMSNPCSTQSIPSPRSPTSRRSRRKVFEQQIPIQTSERCDPPAVDSVGTIETQRGTDFENEVPTSYGKAVEIAWSNASSIPDTARGHLEEALGAIWKRLNDDPEFYMLTDDEFLVFKYFLHRFARSPIAERAISRYFQQLHDANCASESETSDSVTSDSETDDEVVPAGKTSVSNCSQASLLKEVPTHAALTALSSGTEMPLRVPEPASDVSKETISLPNRQETGLGPWQISINLSRPASAESALLLQANIPPERSHVESSTSGPAVNLSHQSESSIPLPNHIHGSEYVSDSTNDENLSSPTSSSQSASTSFGTMEQLEETLIHLSAAVARMMANGASISECSEESDHESEDVIEQDHTITTSRGEGAFNCFGNSSGGSADSGRSFSSSQNASISTNSGSSSRGNKRTCRLRDEQERDENEDPPEKSPRASPSPETVEKNSFQIPCFVDNCLGKDTHVSELMRKAARHHNLFVCTGCYLSFHDENDFKDHRVGGTCEQHCISSECDPSTSVTSGALPAGRRHRRRMDCPAIKMVSVRDRWHYLHTLKYPDRSLPDPVLMLGEPHPHGQGQPRPHRRHRRRVSDLASLEERLTRAKFELQALRKEKSHDDMLREISAKQQEDRIIRLENIIAAFVSLMCGTIPEYLARMIKQDAPTVFPSQPSTQSLSYGPTHCGKLPSVDTTNPYPVSHQDATWPHNTQGPTAPLTPPASAQKRPGGHGASHQISPNHVEPYPSEDVDMMFRDILEDPGFFIP